jgi:hypothetical protein
MQRKAVESSNIVSVGHESTTLEIEFKGGAVYQYADVPAAVAADLLQADSIGKFFHRYIKGEYEFVKVS